VPFNFNIGLPGPFTYSKRVGGGSSAKNAAKTYLGAHAEAARHNERELPPECYPKQPRADRWTIALIVVAVLLFFVGGYFGLPMF
jgi:hypothetical protein